MTTDGLRRHIYDLELSPAEAVQITQLPYTIARFLYITSIYFSQMAVLLLYWRLFSITRIRFLIIGMLVYATCWFLGIV